MFVRWTCMLLVQKETKGHHTLGGQNKYCDWRNVDAAEKLEHTPESSSQKERKGVRCPLCSQESDCGCSPPPPGEKKPVGSGHPKIFLRVETCGGLGVEDDELEERLAGTGAARGEHGVRTVREGNAARVVEGRTEGGWRTRQVRDFTSAFLPNSIKK